MLPNPEFRFVVLHKLHRQLAFPREREPQGLGDRHTTVTKHDIHGVRLQAVDGLQLWFAEHASSRRSVELR